MRALLCHENEKIKSKKLYPEIMIDERKFQVLESANKTILYSMMKTKIYLPSYVCESDEFQEFPIKPLNCSNDCCFFFKKKKEKIIKQFINVRFIPQLFRFEFHWKPISNSYFVIIN